MLVSLILSSFLLLNCFGFVEGDQQGDTRLKTLKNLIYNNAETTVKLDSTALKQLIQLSTTGTFPNRKQRVSFSVYPKSKDLKLGKGQTVIYDGILTNDGNGYDDRTGIFTCPVAGTYMFVLDCLSPKPTTIRIVMNNNAVGSVHIASANYGISWQQLSRTVILKARKGDHVKIVNGENNGFMHRSHYSGFSGTLLD
ncbi:complement C1q subcomponent subunit A-like [Ostrea edulis]|uniref:complement C1q subcomponent subunit A-like n=1 Tax=Ostrea edulis TaxID=37623 RepID=UPI0024AF76EB|nr:complement C1q subcomponent subunit A-like [Ostrea edulis]XP_055999607.1 complement C1q subcomponent subunit A-like [Ostrea edulis]